MPRFMHTADLQVGRVYRQFDSVDAPAIAEERIHVVARMAALASERQVDAVLVAGDVFDLQTVPDRVIRQLFGAMAGYVGTWVLIPGNHDAALAESVWTRAQRLNAIPPNVRVMLEPGVVGLPACQTAVLAAPLTQRHTYNDTTEFFDGVETPPGWLRIGLAHGSVEGILAEDIDSANPISSSRCETARLDYLALGDWHGHKRVNHRCSYSGTPEQDRFRGNQPGYCLIVDLQPGVIPTVEAVRVGRYRWHEIEHAVAVDSDIDLLCARLATFARDDIGQVRVSGRSDLAGQRRLLDAMGRAQAEMRSLSWDVSDLRLMPTAEDIASLKADGYLSEVIEELRAAQADGAADADARVAREALTILCGALASSTVGASSGSVGSSTAAAP
ncbi:metallophosphoesterase family protein [Pseudaquabacterium pictum]